MKNIMKRFEVIVCKAGHFKTFYVKAWHEDGARTKARRLYAVDGWYLWNVSEQKEVPKK